MRSPSSSNSELPCAMHRPVRFQRAPMLVRDCEHAGLVPEKIAFCLWAVLCGGIGARRAALAQTAVDLELVHCRRRLPVDGPRRAAPAARRLCAGLPRSRGAQGHHLGPQRAHRRHLHGVGRPAHAAGRHALDHRSTGPGRASAFADRLEASPISRARMTSISAALQFSGRLFDSSGVKGIRRVIDVSGDGPNNAGVPVVPRARRAGRRRHRHQRPADHAQAARTGLFDLDDLDRYYADCVIGGTGAFMIPIKRERRVPDRHPPQAAAGDRRARAAGPPHPRAGSSRRSAIDCLIGEKQWRQLHGRPDPELMRALAG